MSLKDYEGHKTPNNEKKKKKKEIKIPQTMPLFFPTKNYTKMNVFIL